MSLLSPAAITRYSQLVQSLAMPDTYQIERPGTAVDDGYGHKKPGSDTVVGTGVCQLHAAANGSAESAIAERLTITRPAVIELPPTADVTGKDRIQVNGGSIFEVIEIIPAGLYAVTITAVCAQVG